MPEFKVTTKYLLGDKVNFRDFESIITSIRIFNNKKIKTTYGLTYRRKKDDWDTKIVDVPEKEISNKPIKKPKGD